MRDLPENFRNDDIDAFLRLAKTQDELRDLISFLIEHRERLKEAAMRELEAETDKLIHRLHELQHEELREELSCFKDTLALQRRLLT